MRRMNLVCASLFALHGYAEVNPFVNDVSVGAGQSLDGVDAVRLGARKDSGCRWLASGSGWLSAYCEASLTYWHKRQDEVYAAAFSPVFVYYLGAQGATAIPYLEASVGAASLSATRIGARRLAGRQETQPSRARLRFGFRTCIPT